MTLEPASQTPVLYVAGVGRSGSTLLDRLLGANRGFHSGGEVQGVWQLGVLDDRICSCGSRFSECPFWTKIRQTHPTVLTACRARNVLSYADHVLRTRMMGYSATGNLRARTWARRPPGYDAATVELYQALQHVSGRPTVVDSSKHPIYLYHLAQMTALSVRVVHLIRDPRAVAFSWARRAASDPDGRNSMSRFGPVQASAIWTLWNLMTEAVCRDERLPYLRVRYESLVANPDRAIAEIVRFAQGDSQSRVSDVMKPDSTYLESSHIISGNPMRFTQGDVRVREDRTWQSEMERLHRMTIGLLASPLMTRYGYVNRMSKAN